MSVSGPPVRIRLSRERGFELQAHSMSVNGRAAINCARPNMWSNPYVIGRQTSREASIAMFIRFVRPMGQTIVRDLRGFNLACWCALDEPCHCDHLLERANVPTVET